MSDKLACCDPVQESLGAARLPGVMALGYIGAFSETLALAVVSERALMPLVAALKDEPEEHMRAAAAWSIGQVCIVRVNLRVPRPGHMKVSALCTEHCSVVQLAEVAASQSCVVYADRTAYTRSR